jgi:NADH-quinone oxidoreductase subunit G
MIRENGRWREVDWQVALAFVVNGLKGVRDRHGAAQIGALATPHQTLEELYLLQKLARGLGSSNVDFRTRQADFGADAGVVPWLGMPLADVALLDRVLVIGSTLRKDHPLLANRLRQAAKKLLQVNLVHAVDDDLQMRVANKAIVAPSLLAHALAQVVKAVAQAKGVAAPADVAAVEMGDAAKRMADSLVSGKHAAIFLGNFAQHHPAASQLHALAQTLAELLGAKFGFLGEAANSVGGYLAGAAAGELDARQMMARPRKAYVLLGAEPEFDCFDPQQAMAAMKQAEFVVAMSPYEHGALEYAHALLPIGPYTETSGTFVSTEGRVQSFRGLVQPLAETRPAWKVLRVLGNMLGVDGFDYDSSEQVLKDALSGGDVGARLNNRLQHPVIGKLDAPRPGIERIGEVPIYQADAIVRRAASLQKTRDAAPPAAAMGGELFAELNLREGDSVKITQGVASAVLAAVRDDKLPAGCVRVAAAHALTAGLGAMIGSVTAERVAAPQKVAV